MRLPQCEIREKGKGKRDKNLNCLFVAGGRIPNIDWFREVASERKIFCIDKGIELCRACNIIPNILIGDFDSAESSAVDWARKKKCSR